MLIMQFPEYCISSTYPSHLRASHIGSDISLITPVWFLVSTILIIHQVTLWCYPWFILKNSLSYKVSVFTTFRKLLCLNKVSVYCWPFQSGTMHLLIYYLLPFLIKPLQIILFSDYSLPHRKQHKIFQRQQSIYPCCWNKCSWEYNIKNMYKLYKGAWEKGKTFKRNPQFVIYVNFENEEGI